MYKKAREIIEDAKKTLHSSSAGVTLVEMMVVVSIIVIISTLVVVNWRGAQENLAVSRAAHQVVQSIHVAKDYAVQTRADPGLCGAPTEELTGYGIYFRKGNDFYSIFAKCTNTINGAETMGAAPLETVQLDSRVMISDVKFFGPSGGMGGPWNGVRIRFLPPEGETQIVRDEDLPPFLHSKVEVTLAAKNDVSETKTIAITNEGIISNQ